MSTDASDSRSALWSAPSRSRLVRLCAGITGDAIAAEDLAQETLVEAWRHAAKLNDDTGVDRWLNAIARNVCRRWARERGREAGHRTRWPTDALTPDGVPPDALTDATPVGDDLEREELAALIEEALGGLSADAREVLVLRYVDERPVEEIARRVGVSPAAVSMRLTRAKAALRRTVEPRMGAEAPGDQRSRGWVGTRLWCTDCGVRRLLLKREPAPGSVTFRCPGCDAEPGSIRSELRLDNPSLARVVGDIQRPSAVLARTENWSWRYFQSPLQAHRGEAPGRVGEPATCTRCFRPVTVLPYTRDDSTGLEAFRRGLCARCDGCGEEVSSSLCGMALALPAVRRFRRDHPRSRTCVEREVVAQGRRTTVVRFEDLTGTARIDVLFDHDTLRAVGVNGVDGVPGVVQVGEAETRVTC